MEPSPTICLYPDDEDVYISKEIRHGGVWERDILTKAFQDILRNDPGLGVIDIGANIGLYSLVSAAMGHNVIAVEPFDANLRRLGKAINLGHFTERIIVVRNAVSDRRMLMSLIPYSNNKGGTYVNDAAACTLSNCVQSIYMEDLATLAKRHFLSRRAMIKIDIERHERFAFRRCDGLLDAIYVPYIFMEWHITESFKKPGTADWKLVNGMIEHLTKRGYEVFCARFLTRQDINAWNNWPGDVVWKHKSVNFK